jgi:hypothetical protein
LASAETRSLAPGAEFFERARRRLEAREIHEALMLFSAAEQAGFDPDECGGGRWFCRMLTGDFEQAWRESDCIAGRGAPDPNRLWSGCPLDGTRVIVRCLHGLGDAIQFIRFARPLKARVARLFVEAPGCLVRLFQTMPELDEIFTWDDPESTQPDWNEQIEVMELARYFRATPDRLPATIPYLFPPDAPRIAGEASLTKVGIAWSSSGWYQRRSAPLRDLLPVLSTPACRFFSLQKDRTEVDTEGIAPELRPRCIISQADDVQATASYVKQLDLVITVDTMMAHLAGALGKPVWLMLEQCADWRWMMDRTDSPWYPTMRIFRQTGNRGWSQLAEQIAPTLRTFAAAGHTRTI